ncbi:hypothetical protein CEUSTIGMA_g4635.t1 [Chlamydomonas eustigma]|uniref:PDEase domain-containing protein n=1 Tax=Chlamydomonas eustigma TaxID=1157962 RepID=A0A250X2M5_9CHLO|nr:hypothetical protein CEUSTIGMA_g4635.t1 [Chlamydomonas eustigma]|eukprot:GAX77189.1 hypothetical protein CEUSTIGMA_g4635.t1 [Chlamydomonas eustigma]
MESSDSSVSPPQALGRKHFSTVSNTGKSTGSNQAAILPGPWDSDTQMLALKVAFKCADLGHLTGIPDVHRKWVSLLEEEMFLQSDRERMAGLQGGISSLMDRTKGGITRSQCGFFNVVATPM